MLSRKNWGEIMFKAKTIKLLLIVLFVYFSATYFIHSIEKVASNEIAKSVFHVVISEAVNNISNSFSFLKKEGW